jgi:hypothetical protein
MAMAVIDGSVVASEASQATSSVRSLLPAVDVATSKVQAWSAGTSLSSALYRTVDDGTTYAASDDDTTRVQSLSGATASSHMVAYPTVAGSVTSLSTHIRARRTQYASGSVRLKVYDGESLVGTTPAHSLGTAYSNFDHYFDGLQVLDGSQVRVEVLLTNSAGRGNIRYTQQWVDTTSGPTVTISTPADDSTLSGVTTVDGSVVGMEAIRRVDISVDSAAPEMATGTSSWRYDLDTTALANGAHTLSATATDEAGSTSVSAVNFTVANDNARWIPSIGTPFMWLLEHPLNVNSRADMGTGVLAYNGLPAPDPQVYDIDGFDNSANTVNVLHSRGLKAICYLSAGTWENWRPDASDFPTGALGSNVSGWNGERWIDVRRRTTVWPLMEKRLDMCAAKGFDAVEFDNVDGYTNKSGFPLTSADQLAYNRFLAVEAHERGLSAGLKNDVDQLASLWQYFDFAINEQCNQYSECAGYKTYFINNGKAVFQIEYKLTRGSFCPAMNNANIDSQSMSLNLDGGRQPCR